MHNRIANAATLSHQSWVALKRNSHLLVFPMLASIAMVGLAVMLVASGINTGWIHLSPVPKSPAGLALSDWLLAAAIAVVYYLVAHTLVLFSNTALVGATLKLLRRKQATVEVGLGVVIKRFRQIMKYALLSAIFDVVTTLISLARFNKDENTSISHNINCLWIGVHPQMWRMAIVFVLPLLATKNLGAMGSVQSSLDLFQQTWGDDFLGKTTLEEVSGVVYLTIWLIGSTLFFSAIHTASPLTLVAAWIFLIVAFGLVRLINGAINGVLQASLYNYAITGDAGRFIETSLAQAAFR